MTIDAENKTIAVSWGIPDVQCIRPDLDDEQAWEVLCQMDKQHDATLGINWEVLDVLADIMFPEPEEA